MLVLMRRLNEKIYINDNVCIQVLQIEKNQVKLGFEAPREIRILRGEVKDCFGTEMTESKQNAVLQTHWAAGKDKLKYHVKQ